MFNGGRMMEKNAVLGNIPNTKTAAKGVICPVCAASCDMSGSLPKCPNHGTEPFEAKNNQRK
jgi:hypothetical protein